MKLNPLLHKLYVKLGIRAVYRGCVKNPFLFIARKKHWHLLFRMLPIDKSVIFFESHRGLSYSDNPKAICDELISSGMPVTCVWSVEDPALAVPDRVKKIRRFSISYYYYHACARMLVHNGEFAQGLPIRRDQTYINTQHGTPLKLMGTDIPHKKSDLNPESYSKDGRWSYLLSPNRYTTDIFKRVYIYSGRVLEAGYPRNDIFYLRNTPDEIARIKRKYGIPFDRKVMLYAPTWRDSGNKRTDSDFKLRLEIGQLFDRFGDSHVIMLRLHHLIASENMIDSQFADFAFEFSAPEYDIQELMLISDILITDYSSVMFDFTNLRRPIIFFAYDLEEYSSAIRGTYFDLKVEAPGPLVTDMEALIDAIEDIEVLKPDFVRKQNAFYEKFCSLEDGAATRRVIDGIIKPEMGIS